MFLGYKATNRNIVFQDSLSNQFKCARHVIFDEAFYNRSPRPPYAQQLYEIGNKDIIINNKSGVKKSNKNPSRIDPRLTQEIINETHNHIYPITDKNVQNTTDPVQTTPTNSIEIHVIFDDNGEVAESTNNDALDIITVENNVTTY